MDSFHPDFDIVQAGFVPEPSVGIYPSIDLEVMLSPESKVGIPCYSEHDRLPRRAVYHLNRTRKAMADHHSDWMLWINAYWKNHSRLTPKLERLLRLLAAEYLVGYPNWSSVYGDDTLTATDLDPNLALAEIDIETFPN